MKSIALFLMSLIPTLAFAGDLNPSSQIMMRYHSLPFISIKSVKAEVDYQPETPRSLPSYEGTVYLKAVVEGNTCTGDEYTLGTYYVGKNGKSYLQLLVGTPTSSKSMGCPQYSSPTEITINLPVNAYEIPGQPTTDTLGVIEYSDSLTGQMGESEIIYSAKGGKFEVKLVKLK